MKFSFFSKSKLRILLLSLLTSSIFAAPVEEGVPDSNSSYSVAQNNNSAMQMQVETNNNPDDLQNTVTQLQQQVRDLQGQLELQAHQIDQLREAQKNIFLQLENKSPANLASETAVSAAAEAVTQISQTTPVTAHPKPAAAPEASVNVNPIAAAAPAVTTQSDPKQKELYDRAYQAISAQQYSDASIEMQDYLTQYPMGEYAANAHYWMGEISLVGGDLNKAELHFKAIPSQFPQSSKVPDADLKLGYIYYQQGKWAIARDTLQKLVSNYPNSSASVLAKQRIQEMNVQGV